MKYLIFIVALLMCACDSDAESTSNKTSDTNSKNRSSKGLVCVQAIGKESRKAYLGVVSFKGKQVMSTRIVMSMAEVPVTLVIDDGDDVTSYMISDANKKGTYVLAADKSAFDKDKGPEYYFSSAKYIYGECKPWAVQINMLIPPSNYEFTQVQH